MIVNKITNGYVVQRYDTVKKRFVSQEFVAGKTEWETTIGSPLSPFSQLLGPMESYLPFDMVRPPGESPFESS